MGSAPRPAMSAQSSPASPWPWSQRSPSISSHASSPSASPGPLAARLLTGRSVQGSSTWFYWLREPVPSPDGKTVTLVSDGPTPLQSDIVLHSFDLPTKKLTSLGLPESLALGQQDPAWRPDGRFLLYVKNG